MDAARFDGEVDARGGAWRPSLNLLVVVAVIAVAVEFIHPVVYEAPTVRATIETAMTLLALASAWFFGARFTYSRRLGDLLLLGAVLTLGQTYLCSYALPAAVNAPFGNGFADTGLWGGLFVSAMFVAAAIAPTDKVFDDARRPVALTAAVSGAAVAVAALCALLLRGQLAASALSAPRGLGSELRHPLLLVLVLGASALFVRAARGFARAGRHEGDDVALLLAAGAVLLAASQFSHLAGPSLGPKDIAIHEGIRLMAVSLILAAAVRREAGVPTMVAQAASIAERRRVAADLHDGLAQDLALIAAYGERIEREMGAEHPVVIAARRALTVSRGAIAELTGPPDASAHQALNAVARELGNRFEIEVGVDVELDREPPPDVREELSRIAREAIANAARHGGANHVLVTLNRRRGEMSLQVRDDGCGIGGAAEAVPGEGFGLSSIRNRAAALGGSLTVRQPGTRGTVLEVVLP